MPGRFGGEPGDSGAEEHDVHEKDVEIAERAGGAKTPKVPSSQTVCSTTGTIEPGEKSTEAVPGANVHELVKDVTCELTEVKIDEPV